MSNLPMSGFSSLLQSLAATCTAKLRVGVAALLCVVVTGCGGGADAPPPPEPTSPGAVAPVITQQPAAVSVAVGQPVSFSVAATGTAPLTYQWQRNGAAIDGATSSTYALSTTALADSGAVFRAIVSNVAGSATSSDATLTVVTAAPVLTITPQPANSTVVAGASASFTVGGTCSTGTLQIQWQRLVGSAFADIAGATTVAYTLTASSADNGAQFRANLSCSGQSTTASQAATLIVGTPTAITLSALTLNGLSDPAHVNANSIVRLSSGDFVFTSGNRLKRLSADLSSITVYSGAVPLTSGPAIDGAATVATYGNQLRISVAANDLIYVADVDNEIIRRVAADGSVTTIAGSAQQSGSVNGTGAAARFSQLGLIATGPDGNLYVVDAFTIRGVTPAGVVTTYAGSGALGTSDGPAATATFNGFSGLTVAPNGDLYVGSGNLLRRILRSGSAAGNVETLAGNGSSTGEDGTGTAASLASPAALLLSGSTLYFLDETGRMRTLDIGTRVVTTFSGSTSSGTGSMVDGPASVARFRGSPSSMVALPAGGFMVADSGPIRQVTSTGTVTTITADYVTTGTEGTAVLKNASFLFATNDAQTMTADGHGNVFVFSQIGREVRRVDSAGNVSIMAGLAPAFAGNIDGIGTAAQFASYGGAIAAAPDGTVYASDSYGIRRIGTDAATTMFAGSATASGFADGDRNTGRFGVAPVGLAVGPNGDVFVTDGSFRIRRVDATGTITTFAGSISQSARIDGPLATARFGTPTKLTFAPDGTLFVVDGTTLRKITTDGNVSTIAGAPALSGGIVVDATGTLYGLAASGLYSVSATGVSTLLVPSGDDLVLGNVSPVIGRAINGIGLYGAKQLVLFTLTGVGVLVNLP
jgi:hypothetical protein